MAKAQLSREAPSEPRQATAAAASPAAEPRVCYVAEAFSPSTGGTETQGRLLVESMVAQALEVLVVTNQVPATSKREEHLFGGRIRRVSPAADKPGAQRWPMMFTVFVELLRQRATYDVIFVAGFRTLGVPAVAIAKLLGKKTVLRPANPGEMSGAFFDRRLQKYGLSHSHPLVRLIVRARNALLRRADAFVPNTTDVREEILGEGVDPEKVSLVPNAYEAGRFSPVASDEKARLRQRLGIDDSRPLAVFVGRLVDWKGPQHLARLWREFAAAGDPPLLLLVGPDGNDMHDCADEIRTFVRTHDLERHVRMVGGVDNVEDYLRAADLFVFPSQGGETATTAVIEAMACGLPVVTTAEPGVRDLVTDEVGRLVERDDLAGLGSAIEALLRDPTRRAALGRAAADRAHRLYSASVVHSRYIEILRRLHLGSSAKKARWPHLLAAWLAMRALGPAAALASGPASFTDNVLAASWQPAFCESHRSLPECRSQTAGRFDASHFALHGLWPQPRSNVYCGVGAALEASDEAGRWARLPRLPLRAEIRADLERVMPGTRSHLQRHEWIKHGTCYSGTADEYYRESLQLMDELNASAVRELFARRIGRPVRLDEVRAAFGAAFGPGAGRRVEMVCDDALITELRLHLVGEITATSRLAELLAAASPAPRGCAGGRVDAAGFSR